ncbi:MAG: DUF4271 domain-containing protein [Prevotella sp.]|nr:DUF4271 domain-containing protein [Prevotella sp.]
MLPTFNDIEMSLADNDTAMVLLTLAIIMAIVSTGRLWLFLSRQAHDFFYRPKSEKMFSETAGELHHKLLLAVHTCLAAATAACIITNHSDTATLLAMTALTIALLMLRVALYTLTNTIFFQPRTNEQWMHSMEYITAIEGIALMPAVMLQITNRGDIKAFTIYTIAILTATRILTLLRTWNIFFRQKQNAPQLAIYFCCNEIVPTALAAIIAFRLAYI